MHMAAYLLLAVICLAGLAYHSVNCLVGLMSVYLPLSVICFEGLMMSDMITLSCPYLALQPVEAFNTTRKHEAILKYSTSTDAANCTLQQLLGSKTWNDKNHGLPQ